MRALPSASEVGATDEAPAYLLPSPASMAWAELAAVEALSALPAAAMAELLARFREFAARFAELAALAAWDAAAC